MTEHFDVLVIGAGLSGIGAAWHLKNLCPGRTFAILEGRDAIGGTWDLFRYPGIRSDSDMFTLGYHFKPWRDPKAIADGPSIKKYIEDTADELGIRDQIKFRHRVTRAEWSTADARWTVICEHEGQERRFTCALLYTCTGYYDYEKGYTPELAGRDSFRGTIVHPQHWPENLDYAGKKVVVIGSGATAVTLVPALAEKAAHVTMLQRSPTYIAPVPGKDKNATRLAKWLPEKTAYAAARWKNVLYGMMIYQIARRRPQFLKDMLAKAVRKGVGPDGVVDPHFTPKYDPWDQRLCAAPDGDFFKTIRKGRASVVTDTIDTFVENGIRTSSGEVIEADIVVTATGLVAKLMSGLSLVVDGRPVDLAQATVYKGMMYSDVPNLVSAVGYTNASWTLKCDLTAQHACRLLNHMKTKGFAIATPRVADASMEKVPLLDLKSGYVERASKSFPKQGTRGPWKLHQNYVRDLLMLRYGKLVENELELKRAPARERARPAVNGVNGVNVASEVLPHA